MAPLSSLVTKVYKNRPCLRQVLVIISRSLCCCELNMAAPLSVCTAEERRPVMCFLLWYETNNHYSWWTAAKNATNGMEILRFSRQALTLCRKSDTPLWVSHGQVIENCRENLVQLRGRRFACEEGSGLSVNLKHLFLRI